VGVLKPGRALVVEIGERALLQLGRVGALGVEPAVAQLDQALRCGRDGLDPRVALRLLAGREVADEAAQVNEVLLVAGALLDRGLAPLLDKGLGVRVEVIGDYTSAEGIRQAQLIGVMLVTNESRFMLVKQYRSSIGVR